MFILWWSFNEFGTIGRGDCLDVISFSRTFNDFTSKLFDGVLFMKYEEFYQDIYNNNISMDTISSFSPGPETAYRDSPYRAFSPGQANLPVYNESININQDTSP